MLLATETPDVLKLAIISRTFDDGIEILSEFDAVLVLPFASVTASATTATEPVPATAPDVVSVTVRVVPVVVNPLSDPRVVVKSESVKSVTLSLSVMVMVHVMTITMMILMQDVRGPENAKNKGKVAGVCQRAL